MRFECYSYGQQVSATGRLSVGLGADSTNLLAVSLQVILSCLVPSHRSCEVVLTAGLRTFTESFLKLRSYGGIGVCYSVIVSSRRNLLIPRSYMQYPHIAYAQLFKMLLCYGRRRLLFANEMK